MTSHSKRNYIFVFTMKGFGQRNGEYVIIGCNIIVFQLKKETWMATMCMLCETI